MNATAKELEPRERIAAAMAKHGLSITSEFVPFSKSRNAKPRESGNPWRSLNWTVTLHKAARPILTTDYAAGEGHAPASKASLTELGGTNSIMRHEAISYELEHGVTYKARTFGAGSRKKFEPDACDVMHSLVSDSDVLDCSTFEEWASNLGYDTDSRKAEAIYRACLEIALKLRNGLGEAALQELREACQDY